MEGGPPADAVLQFIGGDGASVGFKRVMSKPLRLCELAGRAVFPPGGAVPAWFDERGAEKSSGKCISDCKF